MALLPALLISPNLRLFLLAWRCWPRQAPSVVVEDMVIAAASIRDGRPPEDRLTLPLSEIHQNRADVSQSVSTDVRLNNW